MYIKSNYLSFFILLLLFFADKSAIAQTKASDTLIVITDTTNIDALFKRARDYAYVGNNTQARRICQKIIDRNPQYYDVRTFIGRTYAWQKMYDAARTELSRVLF